MVDSINVLGTDGTRGHKGMEVLTVSGRGGLVWV